MLHETRILLEDMHAACMLLQSFLKNRTEADFYSDAMLRSAVERQFMIVGEALSRAFKFEPDVASNITSHRRIINFRNILVHGYAAVEQSTVWGVVTTNLPVLIRELDGLLGNGQS